jgi:BirA family transcriptional regulator, biotin operon repressor / biotin---[acetyl-CoA-carboxylase] ligase
LYKIPAKTLFMGKNLVFAPECPSTNALALEISHQSAVHEGTVVITDRQTAGKGQRGNVWEAEYGKNLTFSLILSPKFLAISKQFFLNMVISLALKDYLKDNLLDAVYIKWPNDILVHGKKISGILIENQIQATAILHSIVGIGFNINQRQFASPLATSLSTLLPYEVDLNTALEQMLGHIEARYLQLRDGKYASLMNDYLAALFLRHKNHVFSSGGETFKGVIEDVDETGRLRVRVNDTIRAFGIKEIKYV